MQLASKPPKDETDAPRDADHEPDELPDPAENIEEEGEPFEGTFA